ncbi:MAG: acylphosphatase [Parcubacteria bacterium C7867-001]|nr:MAG: acylphosphatase [Parcubacteria bacterium C7867-001]
MNERLEATVSGRVQLVMYRDFVQRKASGLKLTGFVKNIPDGTVRVVAEGSRESLERLLARLHKGSLLSKVDTVSPSWHPATGEFMKFVIAYE